MLIDSTQEQSTITVGDIVRHEAHVNIFNDTVVEIWYGVVVKVGLHRYPHLAEIEWISGGKGRGSVDIRRCEVVR